MYRFLAAARLPHLSLRHVLMALPFAVLLAEPALAQNLDPLENMLQVIVDGLTGPIGRLIAILAVVAAGYMMFTGRLNWPLSHRFVRTIPVLYQTVASQGPERGLRQSSVRSTTAFS